MLQAVRQKLTLRQEKREAIQAKIDALKDLGDKLKESARPFRRYGVHNLLVDVDGKREMNVFYIFYLIYIPDISCAGS